MKHSYLQTGKFRAMLLFGIFLSTVTLLSSCSDGMQDLDGIQENAKPSSATVTDDSTLRFKTIEELENISISDIPGDNSGYTLSELTYECVDTIELRALRFDVSAKLNSATQPEKIIRFSAEVGPELVSVEYYPSVEVVPAHDNMIHAAYPKVERYRNYSDGSRIGPDEFYDYGHFIHFFVCHAQSLEAGLGKPSYDFDRISVGVLDFFFCESIFDTEYGYENGIHTSYKEGYIKYNKNTIVIDENGLYYSGEDFFPIFVENNWGPHCYDAQDRLSINLGNYYSNGDVAHYRPSILIEEDDSETLELINIGKDVEDVSPQQFPIDINDLQPGWYFANIIDVGKDYALMSKFLYSNDWNCPLLINSYNDYYLQYLVVDGRIIHFDNFMDSYERINNINPQFSITKTNDGYTVKAEIEARIYGEKFKSTYKLNLIGVEGPVDEFDYLDYDNLGNKDNDEMNNLTRSSDDGISSLQKAAPRSDGKRVVIDTTLPRTIKNINKCQK